MSPLPLPSSARTFVAGRLGLRDRRLLPTLPNRDGAVPATEARSQRGRALPVVRASRSITGKVTRAGESTLRVCDRGGSTRSRDRVVLHAVSAGRTTRQPPPLLKPTKALGASQDAVAVPSAFSMIVLDGTASTPSNGTASRWRRCSRRCRGRLSAPGARARRVVGVPWLDPVVAAESPPADGAGRRL